MSPVEPARPDLGGGAATPSFRRPEDAGRSGIPEPIDATRIGARLFEWGERTFVMGILNVTPDSFSGDGLLAEPAAGQPRRLLGAFDRGAEATEDEINAWAGTVGDAIAAALRDPVAHALALARTMEAAGADILDVGGESSRPGHAPVSAEEELARVLPVIRALRAGLPDMPISVDTTKPAVAEAALDAGADLVNDVWGVADDDALLRVAAAHGAPVVLMHNRAEARYTALMPEILGDLARAIDRALAAGVAWEAIIVDPGFGFGKAPEHNLELLRRLDALHDLGRPVLLGTSRKSTLGKVLDLPAEERLEATLATTALAAAAGIDIVRVHDVRPNVRVARMVDAVARGWEPAP